VDERGELELTGLLCSLDGRVRLVARGTSGQAVARYLLDEAGGRALLDDLAPTP
jgi:hypothetical protein